MITEWQMKLVLEKALATGSDFAELFFEDRDELNIKFAEQTAQGVTSIRIFGAGLNLLSGSQRIYVYSNNTSFEALMALAAKAAGLLGLQRSENPSAAAGF